MVDVQIKHRIHKNIVTFIDDKTINLRNHVGWTTMETAEKLIAGPFGYEWGEPVQKYNPETWTEKYKAITWNSVMPFYEGYGYVSQMMIHALKKLGVDVSVFYKGEYNYVKSEIMDCLYKSKKYDCWGMWHHFWMRPGLLPHEKRAMYTMWESTKLNSEWPGALNDVNLIFVPCQQNIDTFKTNGVIKPIKILHHGVDQDDYYYRPKKKSDVFTIGTFGSLVPRKNIEVLVKAFQDEFRGKNDVRLFLKDTSELNGWQNRFHDDPRIQVDLRKVPPKELGDILASFDIAVFPSRGEGFGLGGLQAMGVGTTCICTDWGGFKEYLNPEYNFALNYKMVSIDNFPSNNTTYSGEWAEADYEHLRALLRYAYENQDEMHEKGKKAAQWVKDYWTWERVGQQLIDGINEYEQNSA